MNNRRITEELTNRWKLNNTLLNMFDHLVKEQNEAKSMVRGHEL
jgi:hypothetical protein